MSIVERPASSAGLGLHIQQPYPGDADLVLDPRRGVTADDVERVAALSRPQVVLSAAAREALARSHGSFTALRDAGTPIYGTTTGFGPLVRYAAGDQGGAGHGSGLIAHLGAGWGPAAPAELVRASMVVRAATLVRGCSGVRPEVVDAYLDLLGSGLTPWVPEVGSVGASGDLIPLAHIARVLTGEGEVVGPDGAPAPALEALQRTGRAPLLLDGRDALGLANGTSFHTAYAAVAVARAERLLAWSERLTGWAYRVLGCRTSALDARLHAARGHAGQLRAAMAIAAEAERNGSGEDTTRPLQEIYSFRCAPQVLGACREHLDHARRLVEAELDGVSDNPLFFDDPLAVAHGGNFHGQQVAFAADALNAALTQAAVLADRQVDALVDPRVNGGAPPLLAWEPGASSGVAGAQITATAIVAEMRSRCQHHGVQSIPTNGGNQDVVPMAPLAAIEALRQTERLSAVLAVLTLSLQQLTFLRREGRAPGRVVAPPPGVPAVEGIVRDRALRADVDRLARHIVGRT